MNRADFQQLADIRIDEARVLLAQGKYDGAYYLAGYAVECALKACIAKRTNQSDFPDKQLALRAYTHDLEELVTVAGVKVQFESDRKINPGLSASWDKVRDWRESSRYERRSQAEAQQLYDAITHAIDGVLPWVKLRW